MLASLNAQKQAIYLSRPKQDFTRQRKLDFSKTVGLILRTLKKSVNAELISQSGLFKFKEPPTKTALSLARSKIKVRFFEDLFFYTCQLFYQTKTPIKYWKGYRLLTIDGTGIRVPDMGENRRLIGSIRTNMVP